MPWCGSTAASFPRSTRFRDSLCSTRYVGPRRGCVLTEAVRRKPFSIVLLDEIEKASREFVQLFLGVLDEGRLQDSQGRQVSFRNTIIIMTSNWDRPTSTSRRTKMNEATRQLVMNSIKAAMPTEFVNRIDSIVVFSKLSRRNVKSIRRCASARDRTAHQATEASRSRCSTTARKTSGFDRILAHHGARPLNRAIQQELLSPLSISSSPVASISRKMQRSECSLIRTETAWWSCRTTRATPTALKTSPCRTTMSTTTTMTTPGSRRIRSTEILHRAENNTHIPLIPS